jgi:hypothetical protein
MVTSSELLRRSVVGAATVLVAGLVLGAQAPATPSPTAAMAKEVAGLMRAKQLTAFASRDSVQPGRFVAAMHVPDVQLLTVSAAYSKSDDIEYSLYNKLYQNAYLDLNAGALATDKFWVDDAQADGLVAVPAKKAVQFDAVAVGGTRQVFDGDFVPPGRKNAKKISHEAYMKGFEDAEARYAAVLEALLAELKKLQAPLAEPGGMR